MASYDVYVFCDECSIPHRMGIRIELNDGPPDRASIGDLYAGKDLPPQVALLLANKAVCPNTKKLILQRDNRQVFLVACCDECDRLMSVMAKYVTQIQRTHAAAASNDPAEFVKERDREIELEQAYRQARSDWLEHRSQHS